MHERVLVDFKMDFNVQSHVKGLSLNIFMLMKNSLHVHFVFSISLVEVQLQTLFVLQNVTKTVLI